MVADLKRVRRQIDSAEHRSQLDLAPDSGSHASTLTDRMSSSASLPVQTSSSPLKRYSLLAAAGILILASVAGLSHFVGSRGAPAGIGVSGRPSANAPDVAAVSSRSADAYRLYNEGARALVNHHEPEARTLLESSVAIDPTFATAWLELIRASGLLNDRIAQERARQKVIENIDRLPERKRSAYGPAGSAKAIATMERGVKALPLSAALRNAFGYQLLAAGRYLEALREFETYANLEPNEANPYDSQAEVYLLMSQPERSLERYARVLQIDPSFTNAHLGRAWAFSLLGQFDPALGELAEAEKQLVAKQLPTVEVDLHAGLVLGRAGRYRDAETRLTRGIAVTEKFEDHRSTIYLEFARATLDLERNDLPAVLAAARRMKVLEPRVQSQARKPSLMSDLVEGLAEARAHRVDSARAALDRMQRIADASLPWENFSVRALDGEIAFAAGDVVAAERAFAAAEPLLKMVFVSGAITASLARNNVPIRDGSARVLAARGNVDGAIEAYRRLLTLDITQKWTAILEPRLVLQLARLLERKGDRAAARQEYQRFLDLWKQADAGLLELEEARRKVRDLAAPAS